MRASRSSPTHRALIGYRYVGVDYSSSSADLLADAHSIPFGDNTFECVFSYAVLEHLHLPFLAIREIERVLSPSGLFVGTVSQGEPFHDFLIFIILPGAS